MSAFHSTPWTARPSGDGDGLWTVYDTAGQIVFFGMDEAVAHLFAAAPETLAALKECIDWYANRVGATDELQPIRFQPAEIQQAMLAVAKAESSDA